MVFEAPSLVTPISVRSYRQDIDANFLAIEDALSEIQTELQSAPIDISWSLQQWVPVALNDNGVIGRTSFLPRFATNYQTLYIDPKNGGHLALIGGAWHKLTLSAAWQYNLAALLSSEANCRVCVGLGSLGAPQVQVVVAVGETDQGDLDAGIQLRLYDFRLYRSSGGAYSIQRLRRRSNVLMDGLTFAESGARAIIAPTIFHSGVLPTTTGNMTAGLIVPYPATVEGAYFRLGTRPPAGQTVTVELWSYGAQNTLVGSATWVNADADGSVRYVGPQTPAFHVAAGTFLLFRLTAASASGVAANLNATVLLRPTLLPE